MPQDIEVGDVKSIDEDTHNNDDLAERAAKFGERAIAFSQAMVADHVTMPLVSQLVESATSIGAKYSLTQARKPDFAERLSDCVDQIDSTKYWVRMITAADSNQNEPGRELWKEAHQLGLAFETLLRHHHRRIGGR